LVITYYQKEFEQNKFNSNKAWKLINELLNESKPFNSISMRQSEDSTQPAKRHSIPNILNKYFTQIGPKLASAISSPVGYVTPSTPSVPNSLYLTPVLHNDVVNQINNLKCSKSNDPYDIPVSLVKMAKNVILSILQICMIQAFPRGGS